MKTIRNFTFYILNFTFAAALVLTAHSAQYSKLAIITTAKTQGKWPALKAWIAQADFEDEWAAASYLSDDYPAFAAITNAIVSSGVATADEVAAILAASRNTTADALIDGMKSRDEQTENGRVHWHGARIRQEYITPEDGYRALVETYADGFAWTNKAQRVKPVDPEERERQQQAADRAVYPATIAEMLAKRRAAAATTNEITVIVTPDGTTPLPVGEYAQTATEEEY